MNAIVQVCATKKKKISILLSNKTEIWPYINSNVYYESHNNIISLII